MSTLDLEGLKALLEKATPAPWIASEAERDEFDSGVIWLGQGPDVRGATFAEECLGELWGMNRTPAELEANAALIVALRNAAPTLIAAEERAQRAEGENARLLAWGKERHEAARKVMDASWHLQYPPSPELLEAVADQIDCGGECDTAWREHDTNATGCTKSDSAEGCPFEHASSLRDFAKAMREHAANPDLIDLRAQLTASQARIRELEAGLDAWSPIDTAPRDGTHIILAFGQDHACEGWWVDDDNEPRPWCFIDTADFNEVIINRSRDGEYGPSHWRPMPYREPRNRPMPPEPNR